MSYTTAREKEESRIRHEINARIAEKVKLRAGGNTRRRLRDVAADLVNASSDSAATIAEKAFLSPATVRNLAAGKTKPQAETVERIFSLFDLQVQLENVQITPAFRFPPKSKPYRAKPKFRMPRRKARGIPGFKIG